jgi:hypothetical protein
MRINGVNINLVTATGFDVHLVADPSSTPKRSDPSFVGAIALFRHDRHTASGAHAAHGSGTARKSDPSDTFDITNAVRAARQADPSQMHVVIVPYALSATSDRQRSLVETTGMTFDSIEFFSRN